MHNVERNGAAWYCEFEYLAVKLNIVSIKGKNIEIDENRVSIYY